MQLFIFMLSIPVSIFGCCFSMELNKNVLNGRQILFARKFHFFKMGCNGSSEVQILMLGIGAAGKTTILYKLKQDQVVNTIPTVGFNVEELHYNDLALCVWDLGGQDKIRPLWKHYYDGTQGIIYVIDSSDRSLFDNAKKEFYSMLQAPELKNCPVLIFANKQDIEGAITSEQLASILEVNTLKNEFHIQESCALTGAGLNEGLDWIVKAISNKKK